MILLIAMSVMTGLGKAELVESKKIWDDAPHNAFTDLIRHDDHWYCTFREGTSHASPDGAIRVLRSDDGEVWESAARITSETADLRDPKLSITPDGRLMINAAAALHQPAEARHQSMVWFSRNGSEWGKGLPVGDPGFWLWRVTWHDGAAYSVGYRTIEPRFTRLYRSDDGTRFDAIVPRLGEENSPNEATILFLPDDEGLILQRREKGSGTALLGHSEPPYTDWAWSDLGKRAGGPNLIRLPDGEIVAVVRLYDGGARTAVCRLGVESGTLEELLTLPSGGDNSYAGMVWHEGLLWISYYSSHEGKTSIYLAKVRFVP